MLLLDGHLWKPIWLWQSFASVIHPEPAVENYCGHGPIICERLTELANEVLLT
jgi:hypothetical protein